VKVIKIRENMDIVLLDEEKIKVYFKSRMYKLSII